LVVGDFDRALRTLVVCLEELRGQDEPYWMTVAVLTVGLVETAMARPEDALGHLREARALAERFDHAGLSAWSQVQLDLLALVRGRPEEARALLDEGLELSLATHSTRNVTLCLTAFAQLAFVQGEGERAIAIGGFASGGGAGLMSPDAARRFIIVQGLIMTAGIAVAGYVLKDPPKNWWPNQIDPLHWHQRGTPDLLANPPALRHYTLGQMWRTPQAKWIGIQYACYVGCSLFGVAYYYGFGQAMNLGKWADVGSAAGFALADGGFRPFYGWLSEYIGRRTTMIYAYSGNVVFQLLALWAGEARQPALFAVCAVISGGLSGANFPMTAAMVADYYGETNNAVNYGSIYAWKALGGSFAGGGAALVMTGTLYGTAHNNWPTGFFFGAGLGAIAALIVTFKCKRPTREQMEKAVRAAPDNASAPKPAIA
jgi:MFS transporter, OFA family, oxalate/formate antiporter